MMDMQGKCRNKAFCRVLFCLFIFGLAEFCFPENYSVHNISEFRSRLEGAVPGSVILIMPGLYRGGIQISQVHGRSDEPIVVTGADSQNPPVFTGTGEGLKVSGCSYIKFKNIVFHGFQTNGINIDDGGDNRRPSHHIMLENIRIGNIGPKGNHDALKMSGVEHFIVRNLRIEGWGGSGIDVVGCHNGIIENSRFVGKLGFRTGNSIQIKGGSRFILVQNNVFLNAGSRVVQIGGLTGLQYFRPAPRNYEAKDVIVAGNVFFSGDAQIVWVTAQDSYVHHNLFFRPEKWLGRILQESNNRRFLPCRRGLFEKNVVVTDERVKSIFNVGKGTNPESFIFRENVWSCRLNEVKRSLPSIEIAGFYGIVPVIRSLKNGKLADFSGNPVLQGVGPWAYQPLEFAEEFQDIRLPSVKVPPQM